MRFNKPWWQQQELYTSSATGLDLCASSGLWGPRGPALVQVFSDGTTDKGWGKDQFIASYHRGAFTIKHLQKGEPYAYVMRSANLICIDIDGKNGGIEHATELGWLPATLAEISKSGSGYHLFYLTDDSWDPKEGFAEYRDQIGIVRGVDIRATGCVYHYPQQRWNGLQLEQLPNHLAKRLQERRRKKKVDIENILKTLDLGSEETMFLHDNLRDELSKPIPPGHRNNTLFAIGSQMCIAKMPTWEIAITERARQLHLDDLEITHLIQNIKRYGATQLEHI